VWIGDWWRSRKPEWWRGPADESEEAWESPDRDLGGHHHGSAPALHPLAGRVLWPLTAICAAVTVLAVLVMWPDGSGGFEDPLLLSGDPVTAEVVTVDVINCTYDPSQSCKLIGFEMTNGPYEGEFGAMEHGATSIIGRGDTIKIDVFETESGELQFSFYDFERSSAMWWLLAMFVGAVLLLGRWRGLGALAGLAFSLFVIVAFTLPAILDGSNAVAVALVSASLIAFAALFLAHGFELATAVALLSTFASLILTAMLAALFVGATKLTGLTDESSFMLGGLDADIDPRGILLAGVVIGALGVLDDVTVTQVSAVWELKRVQPELSTPDLVRPAMRIGRDHISSTVNTLFLAYAGATLPLLLLFTQAGRGFGDIITREVVATEVVRAVVGSIGLVASVPIATWLAAGVVSTSPASPAPASPSPASPSPASPSTTTRRRSP
jgi:uncharacterized membrane protein